MSIPRRRPGRRFKVSRAGLALGALALYACSTYDNSLLSGIAPSGGAGAGANAGAGAGSNAGGAGNGGSAGTLINGGAATANAGSIGVAGESGEAGAAGAGNGGSVAGSGPSGGASGGLGGANTAGATGGTGAVAGSSAGAGAVAGSGATAGSSYGGSGSLELIDDFEQHSKNILLSHGRNGPWYVFNDGTAGGVQSPFTIAAVTGTGASPGSTAGLHMTATGFTSWGAGEGADFVNVSLKKAVYDASAYSGVSFYAKIGVSGATTSVNVLFPNTASDPDGLKCSGTGTSQCSDHMFLTVTGLKTNWAVYQVLFSKLGQVGYGLPQGKLDPTTLYSVQFTQSNTLPIDLWIDDLSFIVR